MTRRFLRALTVLALVAFGGFTAACGDDDEGTDPPAGTDLSGDYVLVSVTQGGVTLSPTEGASGTLTLTATRYMLSVTVPSPTGPVTTEDTRHLPDGRQHLDAGIGQRGWLPGCRDVHARGRNADGRRDHRRRSGRERVEPDLDTPADGHG